ncbi:dynein light chain Tctex-type 5-B-like [Gigantopelta aegis]|uniref:dynein light chain Tctex-type 5-B-like n=1 Tax=Gigantopelta aegis TaxID=1735272 RepID=UPI001B88BFC4|nr:dynein light chain Tctex-type 5-B-like [Gigantopelta aegis]
MTDTARDKAARLLRKQGSVSSMSSGDLHAKQHKIGSMSTVSYMDEPGHEEHFRPPIRLENTYQLTPIKRFPNLKIQQLIKDSMEAYLSEERYEPELCRQMSRTLSEVIKARVKELVIPRYKIICVVHIGQLASQGMRVSSRCLWDAGSDTFASFEYRNRSLYAIGCVYGIYYE